MAKGVIKAKGSKPPKIGKSSKNTMSIKKR